MTREIKFKVWDAFENKWYAPIYRAHEGVLHEILIMPNGSIVDRDLNGIAHGLPRYVLLQYTGLKDKNGKEIYEGDITKTHMEVFDNDPIPRKVQEWDEIGEVVFETTRITIANKKHGNYYRFHPHTEVIGNIYEHPNLIK